MKKIKEKIIFVLAVLVINLGLPNSNIVHAATGYYVANDGKDSNAGTLDSPWQHIQYAVNHASPGSTITVRGGTYNEKVSINKAGSSNGYMTLQNYNGETPIITGKGFTEGNLISIRNSSYLKITGFEIKDYKADKPVAIQVSDGSNHIEISNCSIHDISTNYPKEQDYTANPLYIAGNSTTPMTNIDIKNNKIYNCATGWAEGLTINGNVDTWSVTGNEVHDIGNIGIDAAGHYGEGCTNPSLNQARNGVISGNTVYNCKSPNEDGAAAGIYVDGGKNIVIEKNKVHDTQHGIEVGCERPVDEYDGNYKATATEITVRDNLIYSNSKTGLDIGGYDGTNTGKVTNSKILNNTLYKNATESWATNLNISYCDNISICNNIIYGMGGDTSLVYNDSNNTASNITMNNNIFYTEEGASKANFQWMSNAYTGLSEWTATKFDVNSKFTNPLLNNPASSDFQLQSSSPAKDAGDKNFKAATGETDYSGNSRIINAIVDCGAYEMQTGSNPNPPVTPAIVVDGKIQDWANISPSVVGKDNSSIKVNNDDTYIYLCIQGTMAQNYGIFLNTDNKSTTGFQHNNWTTSGCDYYIENGSLYKSNSTSWDWTSLGNSNITSIANTSVIEVRIKRSSLTNLAKVIQVGFVGNDSSWNEISHLPVANTLVNYTII